MGTLTSKVDLIIDTGETRNETRQIVVDHNIWTSLGGPSFMYTNVLCLEFPRDTRTFSFEFEVTHIHAVICKEGGSHPSL